jgi:hypothetical protein
LLYQFFQHVGFTEVALYKATPSMGSMGSKSVQRDGRPWALHFPAAVGELAPDILISRAGVLGDDAVRRA